MDQMSFAEAEYQNKKRKTRRELFLERIDALMPWDRMVKKLKRKYHKGRVGRPPYPLETMLRIHCMQLFYNLSDPGMEDALMRSSPCADLRGCACVTGCRTRPLFSTSAGFSSETN